ncbi:FxsA family protein [Mycobacterium sp. IDR2000157661]|uniref:FxsA family protein n=1 Tax=Mycobacterium sp. IDR2000157661 TaxID=2867005 RepID=UPI001EEB5543|nr:FxsA family protein [Mycobacterium sp. IDR2000157661]ULE32235.1 membrane protein FxsA [Mycobacterium sp. IDR2000157661]
MAMRLFLLYVVIELVVVVALASTIGLGWTLIAVLTTFLVGLALAGSQIKRHIRRLRSGLTVSNAHGAATDSVLVALGTVFVVIPGLASSLLGVLLLLPPTRAVGRPLVTALAARRMPLITAGVAGFGAARARREYIDGEVVDVHDGPVGPVVEQQAVERARHTDEGRENPPPHIRGA